MEDSSRFLELLEHWRFSEDLDEASREGLSRSAQLARYGKGDIIVKKDSAGQIFWIISNGRVHSRGVNKKGEEILLQTMETGDFFGEISLLLSMPRTVDVVAEEDVELFMLSREDVEKYLLVNEKVAAELREFAQKRLEFSQDVLQGRSMVKEMFTRLRALFGKKK
jgi:CRP/FNR family transcriptional regulator, cyclic AMP receptor protein